MLMQIKRTLFLICVRSTIDFHSACRLYYKPVATFMRYNKVFAYNCHFYRKLASTLSAESDCFISNYASARRIIE